MRLSDSTRTIIRQTVTELFGPDARVLLYGSRVDDAARGGDIDLLVVLDQPQPDAARKALTLTARLQLRLGDQPIDVLVVDPSTRLQAVHEAALRQGVPV
ncbi:MAG: nucleotidyltransferase domain-containing protein [Thiobacillaceae bacterium]|nr:nucleotidyltransferase domain-containing protein [Thiobacillaceae bacterium]MCX7672617.1 nucleotidyltransferase domain-containing protein [Thiobacillaceae bacterium]MDW8324147.1 nucleotidyltransferase domain-containing protein [Burkholderiales bacterium]